MTRFSQWLKETRYRNNLNQTELAKKSNLSQAMISALEKEAKLPTLPTCKALSKGLNVPVNEILKIAGLIDVHAGSKRLEGIGYDVGKITQRLSPDRQIMIKNFVEFLEGQQAADDAEQGLQDQSSNEVLKAA